MSRLTTGIIVFAKRATLRVSYAYHRRRPGPPVDWVVGPYEIASMVYDLTRALPSSESAILTEHRFYQLEYDWVGPQPRSAVGSWIAQRFAGPWKLGELASRARGFIYMGAEGFFTASDDHRRTEFRFLKQHGKRIVCYFTGNDVRSPVLMKELEAEKGRPNLGTYLAETDPYFGSAAYEAYQRETAEVADEFADVILTSPSDNRAYITRPTEPFLYFFPDDRISTDFSKFDDVVRPVVLHAPSSPVIKGTQLVRAAVEQLREEGYDFEYVELMRQPHAEVVATLARAHIVLNQFFSMTPGVFGIEALAAGCVVMMSPDEADEPDVLPDSSGAWIVTQHHEVLRHLRDALDHPERWKQQAQAGAQWVRDHESYSVNGPRLAAMIAPPDSAVSD